eukprot:scaffold8951_cov62-Phaeocystis_antarctica.AAC.2
MRAHAHPPGDSSQAAPTGTAGEACSHSSVKGRWAARLPSCAASNSRANWPRRCRSSSTMWPHTCGGGGRGSVR